MKADEIIKKYKLKGSTWTFKGFHAILHTFWSVQNAGFQGPPRFYGSELDMNLLFVKDNYLSWYWHDKSMDRIRKKLIEDVNNDPMFLDSLKKKWLALQERFKKELFAIAKIDVKELNDTQLINRFDRFYKIYNYWFSICMTPQDAFSMYTDKFLEPQFKKILKDKFNDYFPILMSPIDKSFVTEEEESLVLVKLGKKKIEQHQKDYFWIQNNYAVQKVLPVSYFEEKIDKVDVNLLGKADENIKILVEKKKEIIEEFNLDEKSQNLIKIVELFAYMQDQRKKHVTISNHYQRIFFEEVGIRLNIPTEEMEYTVYPELKEMLIHRRGSRAMLQSRRKHCLSIFTSNGWCVFDGPEVDKVFDDVFDVKTADVNELKGTVASKGYAKGKVCIVQKIDDIEKMTEGCILVSSMTRPEMVVAMKKASAIVTDEGGITSHAAIVSRELNIPCILGTKIATKAFKDGDMVEVDAEKGIVKKA